MTTLPGRLRGVIPGGGWVSYGNVIKVHIGDRSFQTELQVAAPATSDATVPNTTSAVQLAILQPGEGRYRHLTINDNARRHYRARHVLPGYQPGAFSGFVSSIPTIISVIDQGWDDRGGGGKGGGGGGGGGIDDPDTKFSNEGRRRGDTFYGGDKKLRNVVTVSDTGGEFAINRHNEADLAQHTSPQVFVSTFESPPTLVFIPQRAMTFSNTTDLGSTSRQLIEMAAEDLTVSGFTMRAVIGSSAAASTVNDGFSNVQNATDPENGGVTLLASGQAAFSNLEDADAGTAVTYEAHFQVETLIMHPTNTLTAELAFNASSTSTSFTVGASRNYVAGFLSTNEKLTFVAALGANYDLRLRMLLSSDPGPNTASMLAFGEDGAVPGVQYTKITAAVEESMTPQAGQNVLWQATETP